MKVRSGLAVGKRILGLGLSIIAAGCGSLMSAAKDGDASAVAKHLAGGANPNEPDGEGHMPLCEAVYRGDVEIVKLLVKAGAKVSESCGWTRGYLPLELAATMRHPGVVAVLLENGADPGQRSALADPLLVRMVLEDVEREGHRPHADTISGIVLDHIAKTKGKEAMLKYLTDETTSVWTPISVAAYHCEEAMVRVLLERGLSPDQVSPAAALKSTSTDDWPALYFARACAYDEPSAGKRIEKTLLEAGGNPEVTTKKGYSWVQTRTDVVKADLARQKKRRDKALEAKREKADERMRNQQNWNAFRGAVTPEAVRKEQEEAVARYAAATGGTKPTSPATTKASPPAKSTPATSVPADPDTPEPSASNDGPSTDTSTPAPGLIITDPPKTATAPAPAPSPPPASPPAPPQKPRPERVCSMVDAPPKQIETTPQHTREQAEGLVRSVGVGHCQLYGGPVFIGRSCTQVSSPRYKLVNGKMTTIEPAILHKCSAEVRCTQQREVCTSDPNQPKAGVIKQ